jgi:hypothetical protein
MMNVQYVTPPKWRGKMKINLLVVSILFVALTILLSRCGAEPVPPEAAAAPSTNGPEEIVEDFYRWYIGYPGNPLAEGAYRDSEALTDDLVQDVEEIIASFDQGAYDPFLCAQDLPGSFTIDIARVSGDEATVILHEIWNPGTEFESTTDVTIELLKADNLWLIDEVLCVDITPLAPELPPATTPEQAVEAFYNWYLAASAYDEASQSRLNPLSNGAYRDSEFLTESFVHEVDQLIASFDKGGYDPFLCAQDVPESFTLGSAIGAADSATLVVRTSFEGHQFAVDLRMIDGAWKIDGVTCAGGQPEGIAVDAGEALPARDGWQVFHDTTYGYQISYPADWTTNELEITIPELSAPVIRIVQLLPQAWADQMAAQTGPPDPDAPVTVAPLNVEVSVGTMEEYRRMYYETAIVEEIEIYGLPVIVEKDQPGDFQVIRYVFQHPANPALRVTVVDYLSGFPGRVEGNEDVAGLVADILETFAFDQ